MAGKTASKQRGKPFKPGESGNPNGRPRKGNTLTDALRAAFEEHDEKGRSYKEVLAEKMREQAVKKGRETTQRYIYDRLDGKPTQEIKVQSDAAIDAPIILHVGATIRVVEDENDDIEGDESTD